MLLVLQPPVGSPDRADERDLRVRVKEELKARRVPRPRILKRGVKMSDDDTDATP